MSKIWAEKEEQEEREIEGLSCVAVAKGNNECEKSFLFDSTWANMNEQNISSPKNLPLVRLLPRATMSVRKVLFLLLHVASSFFLFIESSKH
jgi:hypothetical protein